MKCSNMLKMRRKCVKGAQQSRPIHLRNLTQRKEPKTTGALSLQLLPITLTRTYAGILLVAGERTLKEQEDTVH